MSEDVLSAEAALILEFDAVMREWDHAPFREGQVDPPTLAEAFAAVACSRYAVAA